MREIILSDFEEGVDSPQWTAHSATDRGTVRDCRKQSRDSQKTVRDSQKTVGDSLGTVRDSLGTVRRTVRDWHELSGTVGDSLGTVRRTVRNSLNSQKNCQGQSRNSSMMARRPAR